MEGWDDGSCDSHFHLSSVVTMFKVLFDESTDSRFPVFRASVV